MEEGFVEVVVDNRANEFLERKGKKGTQGKGTKEMISGGVLARGIQVKGALRGLCSTVVIPVL